MASTTHLPSQATCHSAGHRRSWVAGLALALLGVVAAVVVNRWLGLPLIVAAVGVGMAFGNLGLGTRATEPGLAFAAKTVLRTGIVLLGLRLSFSDVAALGLPVLVVIVVTVVITFVGVQLVGRSLGLSPQLSLLVASGFSICGNSAIASVKGVTPAEEEEVAAAVGLVTLCGTAAIAVVPALGSVFRLTDMQLGVWTGAGVQDTAQVIAVASAAGPAVLAIATAVKLTRVLFLAPIVAGVSIWNQRNDVEVGESRPVILPLFVVGFAAMVLLRTGGVVPSAVLDAGRSLGQLALAAGMVALGSAVRITRLRRLGVEPLVLGLVAWLVVGGVSLATITALQIA